MKRIALSILFLFGLAISVCGQGSLEESRYKNTFSLEVGTGLPPLHSLLSGDADLVDQGQTTSLRRPVNLTLSEVWGFSPRWELKLTEDFSWSVCDIIQFPSFGVDPEGHPRYKRDDRQAKYIGRQNRDFSISVTAMFRYIWNPQDAFQTYNEFGLGYVVGLENSYGMPTFLPCFTLIGLRYRWEHFYLYAENTFSPAATLIHGGLGWKF